jgi:manganese/iron transport system permease protein
MVILSSTLGAVSGIIGLYVSYYRNIPSGASIVLTATVIFVAVYLFAPSTGIITSPLRRHFHLGHPERDEEMLANPLNS